jgi:hypothetical protein
MKKNRIKDQEEKRKLRRLRLSRETIRLLNDPALLGLARGGDTNTCAGTCPNPVTDINYNCYPTTCSGGRATGTEAV